MKARQLVLFDLDDTLFAHRQAVAAGILLHIDRAGGAFATDDRVAATELWHALEEKHYHSYLAGRLNFTGQRRARAQDFAASFDVELTGLEADIWFNEYFESYRASWQLHDDALPCLKAVSEIIPGVRFGIITNGELAFQSDKIMRVGLGDRIEHVIASGELGFAKPDPRIFLAACSAFGCEPATAVYVGDRLATDALGAAAAGLTGVWLDRTGASVSPVDAASATRLGVVRIEKLADLCAVLA